MLPGTGRLDLALMRTCINSTFGTSGGDKLLSLCLQEQDVGFTDPGGCGNVWVRVHRMRGAVLVGCMRGRNGALYPLIQIEPG